MASIAILECSLWQDNSWLSCPYNYLPHSQCNHADPCHVLTLKGSEIFYSCFMKPVGRWWSVCTLVAGEMFQISNQLPDEGKGSGLLHHKADRKLILVKLDECDFVLVLTGAVICLFNLEHGLNIGYEVFLQTFQLPVLSHGEPSGGRGIQALLQPKPSIYCWSMHCRWRVYQMSFIYYSSISILILVSNNATSP